MQHRSYAAVKKVGSSEGKVGQCDARDEESGNE